MQRKPHAVPKKAKRKAKRPPAKTAAADSRQAPPASTATDLEPGTEGSDTLQQSDDSDERLSNASDHRRIALSTLDYSIAWSLLSVFEAGVDFAWR